VEYLYNIYVQNFLVNLLPKHFENRCTFAAGSHDQKPRVYFTGNWNTM